MKKNYKAWNIDLEDFYGQRTTFDKLQFLIRFAVLAPSSHNSQPWKFSVKGATVFLSPDNSRLVPVSDPDGRNLFMGLGCALENLLVAADHYDLKTNIAYLPAGSSDAAVRIDFEFSKKPTKRSSDEKHLAVFIPKRCVNRNKYTDKQIPQELLKQIKSFSDEDVEISIIFQQDKKDEISEIIMDSRVKIFDSKLFRQELSKYKKNNWTRSPIGITGVTMGFNTPLSFMAPTAIKYVNVIRPIRKKEETILKKYTPTFGIISVQKNTKRNWLKTGRIFERILLTARKRGVQTAVSAVPFTTDMERLQSVLDTAYFPQIFFRMGYTDKILPHTPRLCAEEVIS